MRCKFSLILQEDSCLVKIYASKVANVDFIVANHMHVLIKYFIYNILA